MFDSAFSVVGLMSGIAPVIALIVFGIVLLKTGKSQNVATWLMWFILDVAITVNMFSAGNKEAWLPLGFAVGAFFVTAVLISKGNWKWGFVEITCAVASTAAMILWHFSSPNAAVVISCVAMWIASIPIIRDTWKMPDRSLWWFWGTAAVCGLITIVVAKSWSIEERFFPASVCTFNSLMTILVLRPSSKQKTC